MSTLIDTLKRLPRTLLKLLVLALGTVLALVALVFGLMLAAGVVLWALVRGRRPAKVQVFRWRGMPRRGAMPPAEVVDVEAREVRSGPVDRVVDAHARIER